MKRYGVGVGGGRYAGRALALVLTAVVMLVMAWTGSAAPPRPATDSGSVWAVLPGGVHVAAEPGQAALRGEAQVRQPEGVLETGEQ